MIIAIIVMLVIYHLIVLYIGWNGWRWLKALKPEARGLRFAFAGVLLLAAWSLFIRFGIAEQAAVIWLSAVWMIVLYCMVLLLPPVNLIVLLLKRFTRMSRRGIVISAGWTVLAISVLITGYGLWNAYSPYVRSYEVTIAKPTDGPERMRIVMGADMHFGALSNDGHASRLVKLVNELQPDLVLFPGDIIDDNIYHFERLGIPEILRGIDAPVYATLGNHDRLEAGESKLIQVLTDSGLNILHDESTVIDGAVTLVGRKDYSDDNRLPLGDVMVDVDRTTPVILLDHQPNALDAAQEEGVDLIVSGHTHNGQVFPGSLITKQMYENDWGHLQKGSLQSIVTSGFGFWGLPLRVGTRSELTVIDVTFAP